MPTCHIRLEAPKLFPAGYPRELRTLGDHLSKRRLDLGLLQNEVAERLGVDESTVCNWEKNRHAPSARSMPEMLTFLNGAH